MKGFRLLLITFVVAVIPVPVRAGLIFNRHSKTNSTPAQRVQGLSCVTARDFRWQRADIKSTSLLGNVLARRISADQGADETILLREGGPGGPWRA